MRQLPRIVTFRIPLPFQKVLQLSPLSMMSMALNGLDFVVFFSSNKIRWQPREVQTMCFGFIIGC